MYISTTVFYISITHQCIAKLIQFYQYKTYVYPKKKKEIVEISSQIHLAFRLTCNSPRVQIPFKQNKKIVISIINSCRFK